MAEIQFSAELISALAGMALSLGFSYIPGLADWFNRLGETTTGFGDETAGKGGTKDDGGTRKRLVMLALLAFVSASAFVLACSGWSEDLGLDLSCDRPGVVNLVWAFLLSVMANQATFKISPRPTRFQPRPNTRSG
jgi:hypothetical protein